MSPYSASPAARQALQSFAFEVHVSPIVQKCSAELPIKLNRGNVPVQYLPPQAETVFLPGDLGHTRKKGLANSVSAEVGAYVDVFEENAGTAVKGGIVIEEKRVSGRLSIPFGDQRAKLGPLAETIARETGFGHGHRKMFESGKFVNHYFQQRDVSRSGVA